MKRKTFYTVRFNDPEVDVELSATFKNFRSAQDYLESYEYDGHIEVKQNLASVRLSHSLVVTI